MAKHWAVIIGLNQYQSLQPLMYAQFDALELRDFLVDVAGVPSDQVFLLTDVSSVVHQTAAYPDRLSIQQTLQKVVQQAHAEDTVWLFFSGYGTAWEGEDYLLPIEADPGNIPGTALSTRGLLEQLKQILTPNALVMLDMNRSQSALPNHRLGAQTIELARGLGMALVLSCQPDQFSQETLAVRHGLFTSALLEGLRYNGCLTLGQMVTYLQKRLPELCTHHWRPVQNPEAVIPPEQQFLMLVPPESVNQIANFEGIQPGPYPIPDNPDTPLPSPEGGDHPAGLTPIPPTLPVYPDPSDHPETPEAPPGALVPVAPEKEDDLLVPIWQRWGLLVAGLLLLGVFLRNQSIFFGSAPSTETPEVAVTVEEGVGETSPNGNPGADAAGTPLFPLAEDAPAGEEISALARGQAAVAAQRYGEALTWLEQVPLDQRDDAYNELVAQAQAGYGRADETNQEVLDSARMMIQPVSASLFNDAIERARQVPLGDPYYEEAQEDINRWSRVILDLAEGRAATGRFNEAIAAASLVPDDRAKIYEEAQQRIAYWQQQQVNRDVLRQAEAMLQPDQASSFEEAIYLVRDIPEGYPEYEVAQQRISQWSQDMLVIARARAAVGNLESAIAAADLIPEGTAAYEQALQEIQNWQSQFQNPG